MSPLLNMEAVSRIPKLRILVLSEIDDWDFGRRLKAYGHEIVAWARPKWKRNSTCGDFCYAVRSTLRAILCRPKLIRTTQARFNSWKWLDKEKIPRITSPNVNSSNFNDYVKGLNVDLIVVYYFPQILKTALLQTPRLGVLNCHPSLLPRYGGPNPTFWMIKNGESVAGITIHVMTEKIDAGDIVAQQELIIGEEENAGQLMQRQHHAAAALLTEAINDMAQGALTPKPQTIAERTYFGKRKASDTVLDWNGSAKRIANLWRALQPYEPLTACLNGTTIKIFDARPQEGPQSGGGPGEIMAKQSGTLLVQTGNGYLEIRSYEIVPFHGWINRILQGFLLPVGSRFDQAPSSIDFTSKAAS